VAIVCLLAFAVMGYDQLIRMPGMSYQGPLDPLTPGQRRLADELRGHVEMLAGEIGERNYRKPAHLAKSADYIESALSTSGYDVERLPYEWSGATYENIVASVGGDGQADEIVVVGSHYDTVEDCPGANDNGSGVAAMISIARMMQGRSSAQSVRFVAFANEEPPHFQTDGMGSLVYAKHCRKKADNIVAMLSLETIGFYSDEEGSQNYPAPFSLFYPSRGDFIAVVGDLSSRRLVRRVVGDFRLAAKFPSEGVAAPRIVEGIGWSDQWSFWQVGYPAVMVTDTAPFRYPHYHTATDTPDQVDYGRMARVVEGLAKVIEELTLIQDGTDRP
jgi:hypothetical protein